MEIHAYRCSHSLFCACIFSLLIDQIAKIERKFESEARTAFFSTAPIDSIETLMKQFRFMQFIFFLLFFPWN